MGDIIIQRDRSEIWWTGQPARRPIDEANPPRVPVGAEVHFLIRFVNQGRVTRSVDTRATMVDPVGRIFTPTWYPEPVFPRDLPRGTPSGRALFFITQTAGSYSPLFFEVFADGALSDSWSFPACIAVDPAPPPAPPPAPSPEPPPAPPPETGAFVGLIGMVLIAELVAGLAEGAI